MEGKVERGYSGEIPKKSKIFEFMAFRKEICGKLL